MNDSYKIRKLDKSNASRVRDFCLTQIKCEYGYDYTPEWHFDLDSLLEENGMYSDQNEGIFLFIGSGNKVVATIGLRDLKFKVSCLAIAQKNFGLRSLLRFGERTQIWNLEVKDMRVGSCLL